MQPEAREAVRELLVRFMAKWLDDSVSDAELIMMRNQGVSPSGLLAPFHQALVPGITLLQERSFSTRLGNLHERIAMEIAGTTHRTVDRAYDLEGSMPVIVQAFIQQHLRALERGQVPPDTTTERAQLLQRFGETQTAATRIDLRIVTREGREVFFEMKSAKPNKGQCLEMKERLMKAVALRGMESARAYWGVPYDPYGLGYYAHSYPKKFFDFDGEVMMGRAFWEFVGGEGAYDELVTIYESVGEQFSARVDKRFGRA